MTGFDILLLAVIAAGCFFAARKIHRDKKSGQGCCGNCSGCTVSCSNKKEKKL